MCSAGVRRQDRAHVSSAFQDLSCRKGDLAAVKIGGRGQWRVESAELEKYIERLYTETKQFIDSHPFGEEAEQSEDVH